MKSFNQFCSVARALDVVGDRWALLVVRELLLGPRRYTDLVQGLPGVGTNVLATRLRELQAAGIVERRSFAAPTPATVYQLTEDGRDLRGVINSLSNWGRHRLTTPSADDVVAPRWLVIAAAAGIDADTLEDGTTFGLLIDAQPFELDVRDGLVTAVHGDPDHPAATLTGALSDFYATARGQRSARRRITVQGDRKAGKQLLQALTGCLL